MNQLAQAIGYTFRDTVLLRQALTHPSMGPENNQRLEFLGDAVLEFIVSERLYRENTQDQEGSLTHKRLMLVCEETQSVIARRIGLGQALIMDRGEELSGGRDKPSVLCDAMEALLAAVYLDGGMAAARAFVDLLWPSAEDAELPMKDAKSLLQELLQGQGRPTPTYEILSRSGPDHSPVFTAAVLIDGAVFAQGSGQSKKVAEQAAALTALRSLQVQ